MNEKKSSRLRRARRSRMKMRELGAVRLSVNRTPRHIYAQVIAADGGEILAQASTLKQICAVALRVMSRQRKSRQINRRASEKSRRYERCV